MHPNPEEELFLENAKKNNSAIELHFDSATFWNILNLLDVP